MPYSSFGNNYGLGFGGTIGIAIMVVWTLVWKGLALWKAAREGQKGWYVAMLVINTVGILEILYLYVFSKKNAEPVKPPTPPAHT